MSGITVGSATSATITQAATSAAQAQGTAAGSNKTFGHHGGHHKHASSTGAAPSSAEMLWAKNVRTRVNRVRINPEFWRRIGG